MYSFLLGLIVCVVSGTAHAQVLEKQGKNWKAQLKSQFVLDDNVAQNPDRPPPLTPDMEDGGWNGNAAFTYTHRFNNKISLAADYDIDATIWSDLGQFDLIAQMWGLKPKYRIDENSFVDMQYFYMWNIAGGNSFSGVNFLNPSYNHLHRKWGLTRVHYSFRDTDNFVNQARDGTQHGVGVTHVYLIPKSSHYVGLGYDFSTEDTAGRFDRNIHNFKILGRVMLPMDIQLNGEYKFSYRDYDTFASTRGGIREDEQHNYRFRFRKLLWETLGFLDKVTARLDFIHQNNQSNVFFRDYKSNRFMVGAEARF